MQMKIFETEALSWDEFATLRNWCNSNNVGYRCDYLSSNHNYVSLWVNNKELEIYLLLRYNLKEIKE